MDRQDLAQLTAAELQEGLLFERAALTGLQLADADLSDKTLLRCRIERTTLTGADLRRATLDEVELEDCDLSSVQLEGALLTDVVFRRCKLLGVDWSTAKRSLIGSPLRFEGCQLDFGVFGSTNLRESAFLDCSAREVDFSGSDLGKASFAGSDLERARFGGTRLVETDLVGARGYELDVRENDVRGLRVALPEGAALLGPFGVVVDV